MDPYISMGEKSNLMLTIGMAGFCFVPKNFEHCTEFVSENPFESSFLPVVELPGVLRHISFFHFELTH